MIQSGNPLMMSRRSLLLLAGAGMAASGRLAASSGDFWEKKDPSEWSSDEIDRMVTKSPWAKEVTAQYAPGEGGGGYPGNGGGSYPGGGGGGYPGGGGGDGYPSGGGGGYPGGGMGRIGIGGIPGIDIGGAGRRRQGGPGGMSSYKGTVRWESAQPILQATKSTLPDVFANHYVIAVTGIPLLNSRMRRSRTEDDDSQNSRTSGESDQRLDDLKQFSTLQPKGKELAQAGIVQRQVSNGNVLLFGFSRETLQLTSDDKEVDFATRLGSLLVKARFNLKEMLYRGQLAV
jgi:hypothetical protein